MSNYLFDRPHHQFHDSISKREKKYWISSYFFLSFILSSSSNQKWLKFSKRWHVAILHFVSMCFIKVAVTTLFYFSLQLESKWNEKKRHDRHDFHWVNFLDFPRFGFFFTIYFSRPSVFFPFHSCYFFHFSPLCLVGCISHKGGCKYFIYIKSIGRMWIHYQFDPKNHFCDFETLSEFGTQIEMTID